MSKIKKGITFIVLLITVFLINISCSRKVITGKYKANFKSYGISSNSLTLDCDGKAIMIFSHDTAKKNNSYKGVWKINNDTLVLSFDSIINKSKKQNDEIKFLVKRNKLIRINRHFDSIKKNIIKIYIENNINYKKSIRKINKDYENWKRNYDFQNLKKFKKTDCTK